MLYSKAKTLEHPISRTHPKCVIKLNTLLKREGYRGKIKFPQEILVIDMDCVETKLSRSKKRNQRCSMDIAFMTKQKNISQLVFVELKLNYRSIRNLRSRDLLKKLKGSISNLTITKNIYNVCYFVFNKTLVPKAKIRFSRMNPNSPKSIVAISVYELKKMYF